MPSSALQDRLTPAGWLKTGAEAVSPEDLVRNLPDAFIRSLARSNAEYGNWLQSATAFGGQVPTGAAGVVADQEAATFEARLAIALAKRVGVGRSEWQLELGDRTPGGPDAPSISVIGNPAVGSGKPDVGFHFVVQYGGLKKDTWVYQEWDGFTIGWKEDCKTTLTEEIHVKEAFRVGADGKTKKTGDPIEFRAPTGSDANEHTHVNAKGELAAAADADIKDYDTHGKMVNLQECGICRLFHIRVVRFWPSCTPDLSKVQIGGKGVTGIAPEASFILIEKTVKGGTCLSDKPSTPKDGGALQEIGWGKCKEEKPFGWMIRFYWDICPCERVPGDLYPKPKPREPEDPLAPPGPPSSVPTTGRPVLITSPVITGLGGVWKKKGRVPQSASLPSHPIQPAGTPPTTPTHPALPDTPPPPGRSWEDRKPGDPADGGLPDPVRPGGSIPPDWREPEE